MFRFQVPDPRSSPRIPPILNSKCSAPDEAGVLMTHRAASPGGLTQGSGDDVAIPGRIV